MTMLSADQLRNKMRGNLAVLAGGRSSERDISLRSGAAVLEAFAEAGLQAYLIDPQQSGWLSELEKQNIQHCFIALHGGDGEDGTVQGALDLLDITYTGSGVLGSALALDKMRSKQLWKGIGVATADFVRLHAKTDWQRVMEALGKCIVKPALDGSSIGMCIAENAEDLQRAYEEARQYGALVIAERWIEGPEYTVSILGAEVLPIIELQTDNRFYDYEAKYLANDTRYLCPCDISEDCEQELKTLALQAFNSLGCYGWGRVDLMRDAGSGRAFVLEVNTSPGMTDHSLVPMAAKAHGMDFVQLVLRILDLSLEATV